jgi:hypothetical protein
MGGNRETLLAQPPLSLTLSVWTIHRTGFSSVPMRYEWRRNHPRNALRKQSDGLI